MLPGVGSVNAEIQAFMEMHGLDGDSIWPQEQQPFTGACLPPLASTDASSRLDDKNDEQVFDYALDRVSMKMHGVTPDQLPSDLRDRLSAWMKAADNTFFQASAYGAV